MRLKALRLLGGILALTALILNVLSHHTELLSPNFENRYSTLLIFLGLFAITLSDYLSKQKNHPENTNKAALVVLILLSAGIIFNLFTQFN